MDHPQQNALQRNPREATDGVVEFAAMDDSASPVDMKHSVFDDSTPFWRPSVMEVMKQLGWRWISFLPALLILLLMLSIPWVPQLWGAIVVGGGKLLIIAIGIAVATAGSAVKSAVKMRTDPFCIHCGYDLTGLQDGQLCPECGRPFSLRLIDEYRRDPAWFIHRYSHSRSMPLRDEPFAAGPIRRKKSRDGT